MKYLKYIFIVFIVFIYSCVEETTEQNLQQVKVKFFGTTEHDIGVDILLNKEGEFKILGNITSNGFSVPAIYSINKEGLQQKEPIIINNEINHVVVDFTIDGSNNYFILSNSVVGQSLTSSQSQVMKVSASGELEWVKTFSRTDNISARKILVTEENIYVVGSITTVTNNDKDGWIIILSQEGEIKKEFRYGGDLSDELVSIIRVNNDIILLGSTQSFDMGNKIGEIWLIRTDNLANIKNYVAFGTSGVVDVGIDIVKSKDNNALFVLGRSFNSLDDSYATTLTKIDPANFSILEQEDFKSNFAVFPQSIVSWKNTYLVVQNQEVSANYTQVGFLKFDQDCALLDAYNFSSEVGLTAKKVITDSDDWVFFLGSNQFRGNSDIAFIKLNENAKLN